MATLRTVTVKPSGGDYTSLPQALIDESGDITLATGSDEIVRFDCYPMLDSWSSIATSNWTTSSGNYVEVRFVDGTGTPAYTSTWSTSLYRIQNQQGFNPQCFRDGSINHFWHTEGTWQMAMRNISATSDFDGAIEIKGSLGSGFHRFDGGGIIIMDMDESGSGNHVIKTDQDLNDVRFRNWIAYGIRTADPTATSGAGIVCAPGSAGNVIELYNCTFDGLVNGVQIDDLSSAPDLKLVNCRFTNMSGKVIRLKGDEDISTSSDNNLTDASSAGDTPNFGTNSILSAFVSYTDSDNATLENRDYSITAEDSGVRHGQDLSVDFTVDITDTTRSGDWDIGAHEVSTAALTFQLSASDTVKTKDTGSISLSGEDSITRNTSGLLAVYIADDTNDPFDAADWEEGAGVTSTSVDGTSGRLVLTPNGIGYWRHSGTGASSRSKRMIQGVIRTVSAGNNDYPTVAAHMETGSGTHDDAASAGLVMENDGFGFGFFLEERDDDASVDSTGGSLPYKSHDTDYRISTFVDGTALTGYDHTEAETLNLTLTNISSGHAGFTQCCSTRPAEVSEFWDCADRNITVDSLPTGYKAKLRDGASSILVSATESGGTATLDVIDVDLSSVANLVVTDASDSVVATFAPSTGDYIVGGDDYSYVQSGSEHFPSETDGGEAGDTADTLFTFADSETDGAEAGDTADALFSFTDSEADGADAGDSATATLTVPTSESEAAEAGDSATAGLKYSDSGTDGGEAGDSVSNVVVRSHSKLCLVYD